jgi:excisionase family DNA binding protein
MDKEQAAQYLNISLEYIDTLVEEGSIRVLDGGLIDEQYLHAYKEKVDKKRRETLDVLTQWAEDNGFYD